MKFRDLCSGGFHPKLVTPPPGGGGGGTPSLKVVGRLPGTHGLKSLWAPKKGGQNSMCCRRAKK